MKTSVIDVRDMLSVLSVPGVEERIGEVPGVESVTVNFAGGSATVRYDETRLDIAGIRSGVRQNAYEATDAPVAGLAAAGHEGHSASTKPPAMPAPAAQKAPTDVPGKAGAGSSSIAQPDGAGPNAAPALSSAKLKSTVATTAPTPTATAPASDGKKDTSAPGKE